MSLIEEAFTTWDAIRKGTISELENIPEENWDYRTGEGARSLREVARHILEAAAGFSSELLRDDSSFTRIFDPEARKQFLAPYPEKSAKSEAIEQLREQFSTDTQRLREADLESKTMQSRSGTQSKLTGLWFAIAHEMYHRGQLTAYERGIGVVPAMTQQMKARAK